MVKPFFFTVGDVPDDIVSSSLYKMFSVPLLNCDTSVPLIIGSVVIKSNSLFLTAGLKKTDASGDDPDAPVSQILDACPMDGKDSALHQ